MEGFIASTAEFGQYSPPAALGWLACGVVDRTFLQFLFRAVEDQTELHLAEQPRHLPLAVISLSP